MRQYNARHTKQFDMRPISSELILTQIGNKLALPFSIDKHIAFQKPIFLFSFTCKYRFSLSLGVGKVTARLIMSK